MEAIDRERGSLLQQGSLVYIVVHRLSLARKTKENPRPVPDHELRGEHVVRAFRNRDMGTGQRTPYHALVCQDEAGTVEQLIPLSCRGAHAGDNRPLNNREGYNWRSLAVAVAGNADERNPTPPQYSSLARVCSEWLPLRPGGLFIVGHTDLEGASSDPNKRCPGQFLSVHALRRSAEWRLPPNWEEWSPAESRQWVTDNGWEI